jgi:hypothetical protein
MERAGRIIKTIGIGSGQKAIGSPDLEYDEVLNTLIRSGQIV